MKDSITVPHNPTKTVPVECVRSDGYLVIDPKHAAYVDADVVDQQGYLVVSPDRYPS